MWSEGVVRGWKGEVLGLALWGQKRSPGRKELCHGNSVGTGCLTKAEEVDGPGEVKFHSAGGGIQAPATNSFSSSFWLHPIPSNLAGQEDFAI